MDSLQAIVEPQNYVKFGFRLDFIGKLSNKFTSKSLKGIKLYKAKIKRF